MFPEGVPAEIRSHVPELNESSLAIMEIEEVRSDDPDNDGDDDSDLVKCLTDSATACEAFAQAARSAASKFDNEILANVVKEGTAAMALIDDCMGEANEEIGGEESDSAKMSLELAKARTRMAEISLQ